MRSDLLRTSVQLCGMDYAGLAPTPMGCVYAAHQANYVPAGHQPGIHLATASVSTRQIRLILTSESLHHVNSGCLVRHLE